MIYPTGGPSPEKTQNFFFYFQTWDFNLSFPWQRVIKGTWHILKQNEFDKQVGTIEMKVFADKLG